MILGDCTVEVAATAARERVRDELERPSDHRAYQRRANGWTEEGGQRSATRWPGSKRACRAWVSPCFDLEDWLNPCGQLRRVLSGTTASIVIPLAMSTGSYRVIGKQAFCFKANRERTRTALPVCRGERHCGEGYSSSKLWMMACPAARLFGSARKQSRVGIPAWRAASSSAELSETKRTAQGGTRSAAAIRR